MEHKDILDYDLLRETAEKCKRGVLWKDSVAHYELNAVQETTKLLEELKSGNYEPRKSRYFTITSPKRRDIVSISFRDRVYQRALNDNVLYPIMTKDFIYDNFACQKGKGTDAARKRLNCFLHSFYRKSGTNGYYLQVDIKKYYASLDHDLVENMFEKKLDEESYKSVLKILNNQYPTEKGYNAGSQIIQIVGISFLNGLDHFIKEVLKIKYYLRYMDDMILISENEEYLYYCKQRIIEYLYKLKLEVNSKKTNIRNIADGIKFLGFKYNLTDSGKVVMTIKSDSVKSEKRKLKKMVNLCKDGKLKPDDVDLSFKTWLAHINHGNSYYLSKRMIKYYNDLWKG